MTETYTISTTADTVRRLAQVSSLVAFSLRLSGQSPSIILNIIYGTQPYAPLSPPECVASSSSSTRFLTTCHIQPTARPHSTQCDRVPYASSRLALTSWWVSIELRLYLTGSNRKLTKKLKRLIDQGEIFQISHTSRKALSRRPYSTKNDNNTFHFLLAFCCKYIFRSMSNSFRSHDVGKQCFPYCKGKLSHETQLPQRNRAMFLPPTGRSWFYPVLSWS